MPAPPASPPPTLDEEMADFAAFASLTQQETQQRQDCIDLLGSVAQAAWPESSILPYGSFAVGLSLPLSDLDIAVLGCVANDADAFVKVRSPGAGGTVCNVSLTAGRSPFRDPGSDFGCGALLRDFLRHYGAEFDFDTQTAAVALHGVDLPEDRLHPGQLVSVCDPLDQNNNIAQGCTKLKQVKAMLKYCELALA
eukprot:gene31283-45358_t